MTSSGPVSANLARRPKRADARRNYQALVSAAQEVFAEHGAAGSLEEVARRAGVGIGTLYRHFPTRRDLFESLYVDEVEALCRTAAELADLPPWEALAGWLRRFVGYTVTKRALAEELTHDSDFFRTCRTEIYTAGEPLLARAQAAGVVRSDVTFDDTVRLLSGITKVQYTDPGQLERVLGVALDGLRAPGSTTAPTR
ncbi:TetR/AcrR family transcriptional regulator [Plantactinospora endophytica]|uniref:TetR family transcriptional regulator n=1 Tax=Plantactinospora endophytica TaxID=673535 RepID=A0ABQ4DXD9_9ACTN|nr:TetR/AcrR family transcriptional regulator [Plantactinospora endophytica]GIG87124.1 TetR family transcriptional regulator [Plantactinospora endophytica]